MIKHDAEVIVLGLGSVGAFALDALARRGIPVIGLERFHPCHNRGSHHGKSRVYRHAYFEHPDYVPLLLHSTDRFANLEEESGTPLLCNCGVLILGEPNGNVIEKAGESAKKWGIPVEHLDADSLRRRYGETFRITNQTRGLFEPGGGFVRPEAAVLAALKRAEANGAEIRSHRRVKSWHEERDHVRVEFDDGDDRVLRSKSLILTAGAYTPALIPSLGPYLRVTRQIQGWVRPASCPESARPDHLPAWFLDRGPDGPCYYGVPVDPLREGAPLAKIAIHGGGDEDDPETMSRVLSSSEKETLRQAASTALPGLTGSLIESCACLYTETPDKDFILDRVPKTSRCWVAAGLSGHGFKLAPALGDALADLAIRGRTDLPVSFLALSRLHGKQF